MNKQRYVQAGICLNSFIIVTIYYIVVRCPCNHYAGGTHLSVIYSVTHTFTVHLREVAEHITYDFIHI